MKHANNLNILKYVLNCLPGLNVDVVGDVFPNDDKSCDVTLTSKM